MNRNSEAEGTIKWQEATDENLFRVCCVCGPGMILGWRRAVGRER